MFNMLASSVVDRRFIGDVMFNMLASSVVDRRFIGGVLFNMLASSVVDRRFIGGVMFNMLASSVVDRRFIGGVMLNMLASSVVDRRFIGSVMFNMLASIVVDRRFEPRSGQIEDYEIDMCCFSVLHAALKRNSKYWLVRNQDNVSEWADIPIRGQLFLSELHCSTIKIHPSVLV
jgi:hypothetical protein